MRNARSVYPDTQMTVMPAEGGTPVALAQIFAPRASWSPDSTRIAFATDRGGIVAELKTVNVQTGETTLLGKRLLRRPFGDKEPVVAATFG